MKKMGAGEQSAPPKPSSVALEGVYGFRLRRLHALLYGHWNRWFRPRGIGITPVQGGILLIVRENPGLTQTALSHLLRIEQPTLLQALRPLVDARLVRRHRSNEDRRALALYLTRDGQSVSEVIEIESPAHEQDLLAQLSREEVSQLIDLLDKAIESAEERTGVSQS